MNKKLKIAMLVSELIGIGISLYYQIYLLTVAVLLIFIYNIYIFFKWKNMKMKNKYILKSYVIMDLILFCFFILIFRLIQLQLFDSKEYANAINRQVSIGRLEKGDRGKIYDKDGKLLAGTISKYELSVDPKRFINSIDSQNAFKKLILKKHIDGNYKNLIEEINILGKKGKRYKRLNKKIDELEKQKIDEILKEFDIFNKNIIFTREERVRHYYKPKNYFFLIGNIGFKKQKEKEGIFGIELSYENYLKGDSRYRVIPSIRSLGIGLPTSNTKTKVDLNGKNLYLTIDNSLQYILNDEMEKRFKETDSEEAYAIMMNPNNGKILATSFFRKNKNYVANPIFQSQVEPGSIFKPLIVAQALQLKKIDRYTKFDIGQGSITKYNHTIRESSRSLKGIITTEEILKKSSNVGMVLVSEKFTDKEFDDCLKNYGFYNKTGVDYPYEKRVKRIPYKKWDGLKKNTMAFGQGIAVTPLQIIIAFSSVINGGYLYKPYLVDRITDKNGVVIRRNLPVMRRRVLDDSVSKQMRELLELAVLEGTVKRARVEGYRIGGKTGTAQFSEHGRYVKHEYLSSVIGFFPAENPKYILLSMFFKPQGKLLYDKFGGRVAAPVLGAVVKRVTRLKNIYSQSVEKIVVDEKNNIKNNIENKKLLIMPDLKGLSARQILEMFNNSNVQFEFIGAGVAVEQNPKPKEKLDKIEKIKIKFN